MSSETFENLDDEGPQIYFFLKNIFDIYIRLISSSKMLQFLYDVRKNLKLNKK